MSLAKPENEERPMNPSSDPFVGAVDAGGVTANLNDYSKTTQTEHVHPEPQSSFLSAPQSRPLRPSSPSTLSILSAEELDELNPRRVSTTHDASKLPHEQHSSNRLHRVWDKHKGVIWALLAQLFGAGMNVAAQELQLRGNDGKGMDPFEILFVRMGVTVFFSVLYMWHQRTPHFPLGPKGVRLLLVGRALGGFVGVWAMYFSLRYLAVQLAVVITFLAPFLTNYACHRIYGEPFTWTDVITGIVSLLGVILLANPEMLISSLLNGKSNGGDVSPTSGSGDMAVGNGTSGDRIHSTPTEQAIAVGVALLGVMGAAVSFTTIRIIGKRAHALISVNYFATSCFLISVIILLVRMQVTLPADWKTWALLTFLGSCGFIMQFLLAKSLAHEKSAKATNMVFSQMVFAMLGDKLVFGYTPDLKALLGSGLIICGVICMILQKAPAATSQPPEDDGAAGDEESRMGLLAEPGELTSGEDYDRIVTEAVQMQTLSRPIAR